MIVRKIAKEDLPIRVDWMNNPKIYSSMHYDIPITLEKTIAWWESNQQKDSRVDLAFIEDDKIVAMGGITSIDRSILKAETYLFVDPEQLGKGWGAKAKKLLIDYAFEILNLNKLYVVTNEDNVASIKVQQKFGYLLEGRFRQEYVTSNGDLKDRLYFGLLKNEWNNQ